MVTTMIEYIDRTDEMARQRFAGDVMSAHHEQNDALAAIVADTSLTDAEKVERLRWSLKYALDMIDWLEFDTRNGCLRDTRHDHGVLLRYLEGGRVGIYVGEDVSDGYNQPTH